MPAVLPQWQQLALYAPSKDDTETIRQQLYGQSVERQQALHARVIEGDAAAIDRHLREAEFQAKLYGAAKPPERDDSAGGVQVQINLQPFGSAPAVIDQPALELPAGDPPDT